VLLLATFAFTSRSTFAQEAAPATPEAVTPQLPVTVTDVKGNQVTVSDVSRIVPLSGDIAEIVWTLGLGANIVGVDLSAVYPAELTQLPQIGFERQLSAEGILSLNPTLVIGKEQAGPPAVLDQVRAAGVPVVIVAEPQTIEAPTAKIRSVAAALGVPEQGEALAAKTQAEIDDALALAATATSKPTVMFLYVRSGGVQLIGGSGSVADAMIDAAGGVDAGVAAGIQGFMPVTAEAVVAAQPDYIIVPQSGLDSIGGMDALLQIPGLAETPAAKNGHILAIDDLLLLSMTPRTGQALHDLILAIHPELATATPVASSAG
ncbi:MAG TPA: ABC transporter substrate-binding protein, partial [Thermomicrobiales bacterium]|nr:ABC transporter substrate-binding protein [Thermomicrobiales bacterium]